MIYLISVSNKLITMKKLISILSAVVLVNAQAQTPCCYTDSYSSATGWTINGTNLIIGPSAFTFSATPDQAYNYATHSLNCTLSDSMWKGDIDFIYTSRGSGGVGETILGVQAGTQDTYNTGGTFATSNQNAIGLIINCPINGAQATDSIFGISKLGTTYGATSKGIHVNLNTQYYLRLERVSHTLGRINVFTNAARTIHATGSPQIFNINPSITGLSYIEHGSIPQGYNTRNITATLDNLNICDTIISTTQSTCCLTDTYTNSNGWTTNGTAYTFGPNTFNFNATPDQAYNYATNQLPCTLSDTAWKGDIDFIYTGRGSGGVGETILGVQAGTQDTYNTGGAFATSNQNAIGLIINCPINGAQATDSIFGISKLGTTYGATSKGIHVNLNTQYYLRLERLSAAVARINVFNDAARTIQAAGSPQIFSVSPSIVGLYVIEHGSIPQGYNTRNITAALDNLNICNTSNPALGMANAKKLTADNVNIYPNPNNGTFTIETNTNEKQIVQIFDITGKIVVSQNINGKTNFDASNFENGIYFIQVQTNNSNYTQKIIVQH